MSFNATYFDGRKALGRVVEVDVDSAGNLLVRGEAFSREAHWSDLRVTDRLGDTPRFIYFRDSAVLETADNAAVDSILRQRGGHRWIAWVHMLEHRYWVVAVSVLVIV